MTKKLGRDTQAINRGIYRRWLPAVIAGAYVLTMVIWSIVDPVKFSEFETLALVLGAVLGVWTLIAWLKPQ